MQELIGSVKLNTDFYNQDDTFATEDYEQLLNAVKSGADYSELIYANSSFFKLDNLSCHRENIIQWYPFEKNSSVLELNAQCGAVTAGFIDRVNHAVCITDSKIKADIIANRYSKQKNLEIFVGEKKEILNNLKEKFDYILLVGGILDSKDLSNLKELLKENGKLLIATENRNGLKYFAGCRDIYTKSYYDSVENYRFGEKKSYDMPEWKKVLGEAGFDELTFRYPYPDYRFCEAIYSDTMLPEKNQLYKNLRNFEDDRLVTFDENSVYNTFISYGVFPLFANSYFIETGKSCDVIYTKFSKERSNQYKIFTSITQEENRKGVKKYPENPKALTHITNMVEYEETLKKIYDDDKFSIAGCKPAENAIEFDYINGKTLSSIIDDHISENDFDGLYRDIDILKELINKISSGKPFVESEEFRSYFKDIKINQNLTASTYSIIDLIAENLIINDKINMIDYEWVLPFSVPVEYIMFRSLFLSKGISTLSQENQKKVYEYAGVSFDMFNTFLAMEIAFQQTVSSPKLDLNFICEKIGNSAYDVRHIDFEKILFRSSISNADTKGIITSKSNNNNYASISAKLDENIKSILFVPAQKSIFMHKPVISARKGSEEIIITNYTHNANLALAEDLYFSNPPEIIIQNNGYDEIKIDFTAYLWNTDIVAKIENDAENITDLLGRIDSLLEEYNKLSTAYNNQEKLFQEYRQTHLINKSAIKHLFIKKKKNQEE